MTPSTIVSTVLGLIMGLCIVTAMFLMARTRYSEMLKVGLAFVLGYVAGIAFVMFVYGILGGT